MLPLQPNPSQREEGSGDGTPQAHPGAGIGAGHCGGRAAEHCDEVANPGRVGCPAASGRSSREHCDGMGCQPPATIGARVRAAVSVGNQQKTHHFGPQRTSKHNPRVASTDVDGSIDRFVISLVADSFPPLQLFVACGCAEHAVQITSRVSGTPAVAGTAFRAVRAARIDAITGTWRKCCAPTQPRQSSNQTPVSRFQNLSSARDVILASTRAS